MIDLPYVVAGAITGFIVGVTGVGAGALMTPLLLIFFGVSPTTAVATDLWFAAITKLVGARIHQKGGQVDWQIVKRLWAGSLPIAALVVLVVALGDPIAKVQWLTTAIGLVIIITALGLLVAPAVLARAKSNRLSAPSKFKAAQPMLTVIAGAVLGLCVALTSVGAGALGSVMLLYLYPLRMTPHKLVATDLVHAIPLAVVAGTGYLIAGLVDWIMLMNLLMGSVPAIVLGSLWAQKLSGRWIQIALAVVLFAAGVKTLS
ncbi:sulfite exporter TauE/SafE family protein [Orrella daihaiensis]|uniref:Probable membrane transporter protein n=1 Tax=Orrella daihaiensis TaxID=2782176 RepID=A0ABY4AP78_9BURK|nr:sulfite exporter TauE/SafE family protein [Orrella daihaiensis]UOD51431.1 sulfite exporter TauE/SafE family protein [Orrella daihaiensis]